MKEKHRRKEGSRGIPLSVEKSYLEELFAVSKYLGII